MFHKISFDVILAAGFMLSTWVPFLTTNLGSIAAKSCFILWLLITWGCHFSDCLKLRYGMATLFSFLTYAFTFGMYIYFTDTPNNTYYGIAWGTFKGYIWTFCYWLILHYYLSVKNSLALKQLAVIFIIGVAVTAIMTLRGYTEFGDTISRSMVAVNDMTDTETIESAYYAAQKGVGSFSHIYGMMLMIVPLLYSVKHVPSKWRIGYVLIAVLLFYCVVKASFLTAVITLFFAALVLLSVRQKSMPASMIWGGGVFLVVLFLISLPYVVLPILNSIESINWIQSNQVYLSKVENLRDVFVGKNFAEISRIERIQWSWIVFLDRPFFGNGFLEVDLGGHSEIFDQLGRFGLIGVLPLIIFFYWINKYLNAHIYGIDPRYKGLKMTLVLPLIFVAFFNPVGHGNAWSVFLFLVPVLSLFYGPKRSDVGGIRRHQIEHTPQLLSKNTARSNLVNK